MLNGRLEIQQQQSRLDEDVIVTNFEVLPPSVVRLGHEASDIHRTVDQRAS